MVQGEVTVVVKLIVVKVGEAVEVEEFIKVERENVKVSECGKF